MIAVVAAVGVAGAVACAAQAGRARTADPAVDRPSRGVGRRRRAGPTLVPSTGGGPARDAWTQALASAGVDGDPARWARVALIAVAATGLLAALRSGPVGGIVVVALASSSGALGLRAAGGRGARRADALLPDLLEHAARHLRSGRDLVTALDAAAGAVPGSHGTEVRAVTTRVGSGSALVDALRPWVERHPRRPVQLTVGALEVAADSGGGRAQALDGIAATLRSRRVVADETRALASQARASAAVMVALPVLVAALGMAADPRLAHTLLGTPLGLGCVAVAVGLDGVGAWWMQRIVEGAR